jgi:hypothetical protein
MTEPMDRSVTGVTGNSDAVSGGGVHLLSMDGWLLLQKAHCGHLDLSR